MTRLEPWFARAQPWAPARAVIVGGGVAGASAARALRRRGWRTTIVEKHAGLAEEASGNRAAVLLPRLTAAPSLDGRFYAAAWLHLLTELGSLSAAGFAPSGVLQLALTSEDDARLETVAATGVVPGLRHVSSAEASEIAGVVVPHNALYLPDGGWVDPRRLCTALAGGSEFIFNADVAVLRHQSIWKIDDAQGDVIAEGEIVILANALGAARFAQTSGLPLLARRGQITLAAPTTTSARLQTVLSYGGYITPAHDGVHNIGATFDEVDVDVSGMPAEALDDHRRNLEMLARVVPVLSEGWNEVAFAGRAAYRCTTVDHLPIAGPVPDAAAYRRDYAALSRGHPWARYPDATYRPGLYALTGLGARGMVSAPLAAEILAAEICGEAVPLERDLVTALHPGRFLVRDLKRRGP